MKVQWIGIAAVFLLLAGCGSRFETSYDAPIDVSRSASWALNSVTVVVPANLTVSDQNLFAPNADIVWHGDPPGDRKTQVGAVLKTGVTQGASRLPGNMPVDIRITLERFHAVTPRAASRAPAAVHNITYTAQVIDATTGAALTAPKRINADLQAYVREAALDAANKGQTQKVRITAHLAAVTRAWLGIGPDVRRSFSSIGR